MPDQIFFIVFWTNYKTFNQQQNVLTFRGFMSFSFGEVKVLRVYARLKKLDCFRKKNTFIKQQNVLTLRAFMSFSFG